MTPGAMAAMRNWALKEYQLKHAMGLDVASSSGKGGCQIWDRQEQEPGREQEAQHKVQQERKQKMGTEEGCKEIRATAERKTGPCPVCKERHVYKRKMPWGSLQWPSDCLQECKAFQALSPPQQAMVIKEQRGCVVCTSWAHTQARCHQVRRHIEGGSKIGCQEKGTGNRSLWTTSPQDAI